MGLVVENAIDLHCHFGPDSLGTTKTAFDDTAIAPIAAAREAKACGHCAMVLKSHSFASPQVAATVDAEVPGIRVFGGICTDNFTGGVNPDAVGAALAMGARIVWLPTVHARRDQPRDSAQGPDPGLAVIDETGRPTEAVKAVVDLVRSYDAILATGHTTAQEHYVVAREFAKDCPVLVTHAGEPLAGPRLTGEQCRELADLGAVIEFTALTCDAVFGHQGKSPLEQARMIHAVGHERCTLGSDYGWGSDYTHPAAGMKRFFERLWDVGVSEAALAHMAAAKPAELLRL